MRKLEMVMRVALSALVSHKMRSFLTMLGIIIGVAAVIALVAVGQGAQAQVVSQFESLGSNLLVVSPAYNYGFSRQGAREKCTPTQQRRLGSDPRAGHERQFDRARI